MVDDSVCPVLYLGPHVVSPGSFVHPFFAVPDFHAFSALNRAIESHLPTIDPSLLLGVSTC